MLEQGSCVALQAARNKAGKPLGPSPVVKPDPCCCGRNLEDLELLQIHWEQQDPEVQEGAGFGHPRSAAGWSWGSAFSLAGSVQDESKEVGKSTLGSPSPGRCGPGRTSSHWNPGQKPWGNPNVHL